MRQGILSYPLCHAPSIDDADGKKPADCLTPSQDGGVSAGSGRFGDAQDNLGTRAPSFGSFSSAWKKMNGYLKIISR